MRRLNRSLLQFAAVAAVVAMFGVASVAAQETPRTAWGRPRPAGHLDEPDHDAARAA